MKYSKDAPFADVFLCDGDVDFHDYYYISPAAFQPESVYYRVNRAGIEAKCPRLFFVERGSKMKCCEVFCIFSGKGTLQFRGESYLLCKNQVIVLPAGEGHAYSSDENDPLGMSWVEFYGGDSVRITNHIVEQQSPVIEGAVFLDVCAELSVLQQRLILDAECNVSLELYSMLLKILRNEERFLKMELSQDVQVNFRRAEAYIDAHLKEKITNEQLAGLCGISLPYFMKRFKKIYRMTPQEYIMDRRICKGRYLLLQTALSADDISEHLGFCNTSHFIRRFKAREKMTPAQYRKTFGPAGQDSSFPTTDTRFSRASQQNFRRFGESRE